MIFTILLISSLADLADPPIFDDGFEGRLIGYFGSTHTTVQCVEGQGTIVEVQGDPDGDEICRFEASSCPPGWSQAGGWSATLPTTQPFVQPSIASFSTTCNGVSYQWPSISADSGIFSSGAHEFSNSAMIESRSCQVWQDGANEVFGNCGSPDIVATDPSPASDQCSSFGISFPGFRVDFLDSGGQMQSRWIRTNTRITTVAVRTSIGCK